MISLSFINTISPKVLGFFLIKKKSLCEAAAAAEKNGWNQTDFLRRRARGLPEFSQHAVRAPSSLCRGVWAAEQTGCSGFVDVRQRQKSRAEEGRLKLRQTRAGLVLPDLAQSAELSRELSSSASFHFLLLLFALSPETESLRESCFCFLRSEVLVSFSFSSSLLSPEGLSSSLLLIFAYLAFLHGLFLFLLLRLSFGASVSSLLLKLSAFSRFSPSDFFFFFFFFFFREDFLDRFGEPASVLDFFVLWRLVFAVGFSSLGKEEHKEIRRKLHTD